MTWSLLIENGDLVKGKGNKLATVKGPEKVAQDLRIWLLSELGDDPLNPGFGSTIHLSPENFIEMDDTVLFIPENRFDHIIEEIDRIIDAYQRLQLIRIEQEINLYNGQHTFSEGEIIEEYSIEYESIFDTLYVDIHLTMLSKATITVELPVQTGV